MNLTEDFIRDSDTILSLAVRSLFERLDSLCEGAIAVDTQARIVWINQKYALKLGLSSPQEALGRDVEDPEQPVAASGKYPRADPAGHHGIR